jgi:hypothetical protein
MRDLHNNIKVLPCIPPVVSGQKNAHVCGVIDRQGYESLELVILTGTITDAASTYTVLVEDGDQADMADHAAVADKDLLGTEAAASFDQAADGVIRKIGYRGNKRYVRMTITPADNTGDAPIAAIAILGHPALKPTS